MRIIIILCFITLCRIPAFSQMQAEKTAHIEANKLVSILLETENSRDADEQIKLFAPTINSSGKNISKEKYKADMLAYYKRWPIASWKLLEPVKITKQFGPYLYEAQYVADFRVECPQRRKWSQGTVTSLLTITTTPEGPRILATKDKITNSLKGDLSTENSGPISNAASKNELAPLPVFQQGVDSIKDTISDFCSEKSLYAVSDGKDVILVDVKSALEIFRVHPDSRYGNPIAIGFSKNGRFLFIINRNPKGGDIPIVLDTSSLKIYRNKDSWESYINIAVDSYEITSDTSSLYLDEADWGGLQFS